MKIFFKRLRTYSIGVLLGVALVIFFFKDRVSVLTSWLPANRVKIEIAEAQLSVDTTLGKQLACLKWTKDDWQRQILNCSVDFSESETREKPRVYWLNFENDTLENVQVSIQDSSAVILSGTIVKGICN